MTGPLDGIRILDATHVLAGPFAGYQLGLMGANVIRVENPAGMDIARVNDPDPARRAAKMGIGFLSQNANKRSVVLDLKTPAGRDAFRRIAQTCDVVIENFRPGKMAALGLGAQDLRAMKPELIHCAITGFGQSGPLADRPAYDHILQGMSGIMAVTGTDESGPVRAGFPLVDYLAGQMAATAVSAALVRRFRSGEGATIDVSMLDAALSVMGPLVGQWTIGAKVPGRPGNKPYSGSPFSGCYDSADGTIVVVGNTQVQAAAMARVCGMDDLLADPRVRDWTKHPELVDELAARFTTVFRTRSALEWEAALNAASVPCSKVRSVPEVLDEEQVRARGFLHRVYVPALGREIAVPGLGCLIDGANGVVTAAPPEAGQHTAEVLAEAGYTAEQIRALSD